MTLQLALREVKAEAGPRPWCPGRGPSHFLVSPEAQAQRPILTAVWHKALSVKIQEGKGGEEKGERHIK